MWNAGFIISPNELLNSSLYRECSAIYVAGYTKYKGKLRDSLNLELSLPHVMRAVV